MPDHDRPARPGRRLKLSRETLRDLTPTAADAAGVQGGATVADAGCKPPKNQKKPARQTTIIPPPVPTPQNLLDHHGATGVVIHGEDGARTGRYRVERRTVTEFEVLDSGEVVVHSSKTEDDDPKPLE
jgi:hypothetical protein